MNGLSMHELSDLWFGNDKVGMILVWFMNGELVENIGMSLICVIIHTWLLEHFRIWLGR